MPYGVLIVTGGMSHQEGYASGFQQDRRCNLIAVTDEKDVDERRSQREVGHAPPGHHVRRDRPVGAGELEAADRLRPARPGDDVKVRVQRSR